MKLFVDIHYSDFWADPGKQCIPAGWPTDLSGLTQKVQSYTQQVISAFAAQGTPVDMVSIGNEITNGMLWASSTSPPGPDFGCTGRDRRAQLDKRYQCDRVGQPRTATQGRYRRRPGGQPAMAQAPDSDPHGPRRR